MSHIPVDHRLRPLYRFLAALSGIYMLVFGIVGVAQTHGKPAFSQHAADHAWSLGLRTNFGFAVISVIAGAIVLLATLVGRNVDRVVDIWGGIASMIIGMLALALLQTNANYLAFSVANCVATFIIGTVLFAAGMYGKTATARERVVAAVAETVAAPVGASH